MSSQLQSSQHKSSHQPIFSPTTLQMTSATPTVTVATAPPTTFGQFNFESDSSSKFKNQTTQVPQPLAPGAPVTAQNTYGSNVVVAPVPNTPAVPSVFSCYDPDPNSTANRYKSLTKNQWGTGLRGVSILLCVPCLARFKCDKEITMSPEGQVLSVTICHECVKRNRWARFEYKPYVAPQPCQQATTTVPAPMDQQ